MKEPQYEFTGYFENKVLQKRPYLRKDWCIRIIENPIRKEFQEDGERIRFWGELTNLKIKYFVL